MNTETLRTALETIASGNTDPDRMVELAKEALAAGSKIDWARQPEAMAKLVTGKYSAIPDQTLADLLRTAVQTKINHWDAVRAIEIRLGDNLTARQENYLFDAIDGLATSVDVGADITDENAQEVFDEVAKA